VTILGNHPWKPSGTIHGNFHGTWIKLSWNFHESSMKVLSKFRESFIQGFQPMETLGNNPWKPLGTIHGNFHGTLIKLSWNFDQGSMKVLSKFRESFIQGFPWIIPKGFHGFYPGFHGLLSRVSMGFPQGFPRILTWMVPTNSHVETYRGTALSNTWEHMGTTGNLWKPTVGTDHLFVALQINGRFPRLGNPWKPMETQFPLVSTGFHTVSIGFQ
jgi:hypothetical protein